MNKIYRVGSKIKIAVNTRFLIKNKLEGIGLFTYESLKRITQSHPEIDFYFLFDRKYDEEFVFSNNIRPVVLFPQARHPLLWYWWFEISVARWLKKNRPALFLSPDGYACLNTRVPQVLVIHDLAYEHFKEHIYGLARAYYRYFTPRFAHAASRIATVSEFSKQDIVQQYHIQPDKIDVVYNGAKDVYHPLNNEAKSEVQAQYTGSKNYFLFVGAIHPRKNVKNLLLAFDKFKTETKSDFKLVIVGRKAWNFDEVEKAHAQMQFGGDVIFPGHLQPKDLAQITSSAYAIVYVSLFEGFGIPIVEAMSCEVPVITSKVSSMPEVAGDAGLLVDPLSVESIAAAMKKLAEDKSLRNELIEKGKSQIKKFSWDLTAQKLWACCEKALKDSPETII